MADEVAQAGAGFHEVAREPVHLDVAVVADHQPLGRVEHDQALRHVVDRGDELKVALAQPAVRERAGEAHPEDGDGRAGDRQGEHSRRHRKRLDVTGGIGNDLDRSHGGEVMGHDREREEDGRYQGCALAVAMDHRRQRRAGEQHAEQDRPEHQPWHPGDAAGKLDRPHAGVVHAGDTASDDGAAERRAPARRRIHGDREAGAGDDRREQQRQRRQPDPVGDRYARLVGQHGDEVRRPDSASGGGASQRQPGGAHPPLRCRGATEQADRGQAGEKTHDPGEDHQAPVMLDRQAGKHAEHIERTVRDGPLTT